MAKTYDVWLSFGVNVRLDDPEDYDEAARKARPKLIDLITSDSIAGNIEEINEYDDRENPCKNCDEGEMVLIGHTPMSSWTMMTYECDCCGHTESFP